MRTPQPPYLHASTHVVRGAAGPTVGGADVVMLCFLERNQHRRASEIEREIENGNPLSATCEATMLLGATNARHTTQIAEHKKGDDDEVITLVQTERQKHRGEKPQRKVRRESSLPLEASTT
jgi:hypothetical protein